jgi:hemoglobin
MVHIFYAKVCQDELLFPVFDTVVMDNWDLRINRMTDFWSAILLYTRKYRADHSPKNLCPEVDAEHFERWLMLFHETIDELFEGEIAKAARSRAESIARIMKTVKGIVP